MNITATRVVFVGTNIGFVIISKDSWYSRCLNARTLIPRPRLTTVHLIRHINYCTLHDVCSLCEMCVPVIV